MLKLIALRFNRSIAMLCLALALVYAGASAVEVVDQAQHSSEHVADHEHMVFSDVVSEAHADRQPINYAEDDRRSDYFAGNGQHQHGDTGPGLIMPPADAGAAIAVSEILRSPLKDRQVAGLGTPGLERPPRLIALNA